MSITRRIVFGAAASWFSRGMIILMGMVMMPVLFRNLPKEELGLWLLIGQSWVALGILDMGFGATLTRRIAFAKGRSGSDPNTALTAETLTQIAKLLGTGRRIYSVLAVTALSISFFTGLFYLRSLHLQHTSLHTVWIAWSILCVCQAIGVWAAPWTCLLQGVGYIGWDAILASLVNALTLFCQMVAVLSGGGLVALAIIAAVGAVSQRFLVIGFARRKRPELFGLHQVWDTTIFKTMLNPAVRAWLTAVGFFLVNYTDQFFVSSIQGVEKLPAYRAAWVLVHNLMLCSVTFGSASGVFVSHLWQAGNVKEIHRLVVRNALIGVLCMSSAAAILTVAGKNVFDLWLGAGNFIGYPILLLFMLSETLATQSEVVSTASRATEDEAFVLTAFSSGAIKLALAFALLPPFGLLGLAAANVLALLATYQWHMVYRGLGRIRMPIAYYAREVAWPCAEFFGVSLAVLWALSLMFTDEHQRLHLAMTTVVGALMLVAAIWFLVIEPSQRSRLLRWAGLVAREHAAGEAEI